MRRWRHVRSLESIDRAGAGRCPAGQARRSGSRSRSSRRHRRCCRNLLWSGPGRRERLRSCRLAPSSFTAGAAHSAAASDD
jgi:hypothetical protein